MKQQAEHSARMAHRWADERRSRRWQRWCRLLIPLVLGASVWGASGCKGCEEVPKPEPVQALPAVPAPANHVADIFVPDPELTYKNIRARIGGPLMLMPATFPSAVVTTLGLTAQLLDQVDGKSPAFGVITDDAGRLVVVLGVHVRDGKRTVQLLTEGADAKYTAKPGENGVVVLDPRPNLTSRVAALGVAGNYLLSAEKPEDLIACGPYVAGTLPTRPSQEGEIVLVAPGSALKGPIAKWVKETWSSIRKEKEQDAEVMRKEKGRAADFGDPAAALANVDGRVEAVLSVLSDLENARARIDTDESGIHATVTMSPASATGVASTRFASMAGGDVKPLLAMPQDTVLGFLVRDDEKARMQDAKDQAAGVAALLGERLAEDDKKKVEAALSAWAAGRGDWLAASVRWSQDTQGLIVRGAARDPKSLDEGIRSIVGLLDVAAFREPLQHHVGEVKLTSPAKAGEGTFVHVDREKKPKKDGPGEKASTSSFDVAWRIDEEGKVFELRGIEDGKAWLTASEEEGKLPTLGEHPVSSKVFSGIGDNASFTLFADPQLFVASLAPKGTKVKEANAPFVFAYGGEQKQGWFKLVMSHASAREIMKQLGRRGR